jgi:hypothetical protein
MQSWEADSHTDSQEILRVWNSKVRYRAHKAPPLVPVMRPDKSSPRPHTYLLMMSSYYLHTYA